MNHHYLDGEPYYCADCGLGWGEYMVCEDGPCTLETKETAQTRKHVRETQEKHAND